MFRLSILVFAFCCSSVIGAGGTNKIRIPTSQPRFDRPNENVNSIIGEKQTGFDTFECNEAEGEFEDAYQCDKFWSCRNGVATAKYCEDGLVFDILKADGRGDPCDSPYVVDCGTRTELQEPSFFSEFCPRKNGFFADPDPTVCDVFYTCERGSHVKKVCTTGLHFDETTGTCQWPISAGRTGCGAKKAASVNGFTCPPEDVLNAQGMKIPHPSYPNLEDCQKFYVCLNGETPQEASCNLGKVFNEASMLCDYPENTPECDGWYKNDPRFADYYYDDVAGSPDPGKQDATG